MAKPVEQLDQVVIRFCGDSGDGMQLAGDQFTNRPPSMGNDIATFPDFPAEIRAPQARCPASPVSRSTSPTTTSTRRATRSTPWWR